MNDEMNFNLDGSIPDIGMPEEVNTFFSDDNTELGASSALDSGFDADHPFPTYNQLRNAGFDSRLAHHITDRFSNHSYSEKELFHVLYESDDPLSAYNEMMDEKASKLHSENQAFMRELDDFIAETDAMLLGDPMEVSSHDDTGHYNEPTSGNAADDDTELGLADCWPACKALTGSVTNNANWGFHA